MLGKVGKAQELLDVTFVSDDGQQSMTHKVMLTKQNPMKCHYQIALPTYNWLLHLTEGHALPNIKEYVWKGMPNTVPFHKY